MPALFLILWLLAINLAAALAFRSDKRRARERRWRIPERHLLFLALLGGWPGTKWAQHRYRHKTRKQPFGLVLNLVPVTWIALLALCLVAPLWHDSRLAASLEAGLAPPPIPQEAPRRTPRFSQQAR
ncbi:DUF1294 domain-containing protein [Aquicoccus sp. SCR17]|nr:DUF1294 domain-containing protein [Carideicomes alvinocaridis]